jgi:hypothetical protein
MSAFKDTGLHERLSTASNAKRATVAKFMRRPGPEDPSFVERQAARAGVSLARDARRAEREASRLADEARIAAERQALAAAAAEQEERDIAEKAASDAALQIQRKAARDVRYAARKARK